MNKHQSVPRHKVPLISVILLTLALICGAVVLAHLTGCASDGSSAVSGLGLQGGYDPNTQAITGGINLTFKGAPTAATRETLLRAGAVETQPNVFRVPQVTRDASQRNAIQAALREGATLTKSE